MQDAEAHADEGGGEAGERAGKRRRTPVASQGFQPAMRPTAATAAPSGNEPSTVRSGKSSTRKDRNTPSATKA